MTLRSRVRAAKSRLMAKPKTSASRGFDFTDTTYPVPDVVNRTIDSVLPTVDQLMDAIRFALDLGDLADAAAQSRALSAVLSAAEERARSAAA